MYVRYDSYLLLNYEIQRGDEASLRWPAGFRRIWLRNVANEVRFDFVEDRDVHWFHQQRKVKPFPVCCSACTKNKSRYNGMFPYIFY